MPPAAEGSNVPADGLVIPVPDQVPPDVAADKVTGAALAHMEGGVVIVASEFGVTVTRAVSVFPQAPLIV